MTDTPSPRTFSPTDAALEGFRIIREQPRTILIWAAVSLVIGLIVQFILITMFGEGLAELQGLTAAGAQNSDAAREAMQDILPFYVMVLPVALLMISAFTAACYRAVLGIGDDRFGYLRLGRDELRLAALFLVFAGLAMGIIFALILVLGILAAIAAVIQESSGSMAGTVIVGILGGVATLALIPAAIWATVRLSLAAPMTLSQGRLAIFDSWRVTKGHFWPLFGAYVLALLLYVVVMALALIVFTGVAAVLTGGDLAAVGKVFQPDTTSLTSFFSVAMIIYLPFGALLGAAQNAILYAPRAVAYREFVGEGQS